MELKDIATILKTEKQLIIVVDIHEFQTIDTQKYEALCLS